MRKLVVTLSALAALAAPAAAMANSSNIANPTSGTMVQGTTQGSKGVTQYRAAYNDPFLGAVSCTGTNHGGSVSGSFDSFTCKSTTGSPLTFYTPNQSLSLNTLPGGYWWQSDFNGHTAQAFTGTVSADGMSYTAVATY